METTIIVISGSKLFFAREIASATNFVREEEEEEEEDRRRLSYVEIGQCVLLQSPVIDCNDV